MACELYTCAVEIADIARHETPSGTWTIRKEKNYDNIYWRKQITENRKIHLRVVERLLRLSLRKGS